MDLTGDPKEQTEKLEQSMSGGVRDVRSVKVERQGVYLIQTRVQS